jgi:hypothetical protein
MNKSAEQEEVRGYKEKIIDEIFYALGLSRSGVMRRLLGPLFRPPANRLGRISASADSEARCSGITGGARRILPDLSLKPVVMGAENIPLEGPLLVASNHPGAYDAIAILSCIPRKDVKVVISDVGFTRAFSFASPYFIYTPKDIAGRTTALRTSIEHLNSGGGLLIFAHGDVEPEPELSPGAGEAIQDWSRSIEIMLRRVPETWLLVTIASGVLMPRFMKSPIVKIRRTVPGRQKLAEVLQMSRQMIFPQSIQTNLHISFAEPVKGMDLADDELMPAVIKIARRLLDDHLEFFKIEREFSF